MKFTKISTPKKSKKRSGKSEGSGRDSTSQTKKKVIEILGSPISGILFLKSKLALEAIHYKKKIHMFYRLVVLTIIFLFFTIMSFL